MSKNTFYIFHLCITFIITFNIHENLMKSCIVFLYRNKHVVKLRYVMSERYLQQLFFQQLVGYCEANRGPTDKFMERFTIQIYWSPIIRLTIANKLFGKRVLHTYFPDLAMKLICKTFNYIYTFIKCNK